jgi:DNA mismatch endonuclease (patch repair protein)
MRLKKKTKRPLTKSQQMARVRSKDTGPERLLRSALWRLGLRYRLRLSLPGNPDLAFPGSRVAVFVDGCFWHGCPSHYRAPSSNVDFWSAKLERNRRRDEEVNLALSDLGWTVLRFWEHDLEDSLGSVVACVRTVVEKGPEGWIEWCAPRGLFVLEP